jgi:regulator of protease activity HflC (stomatin/prohibitin superfamily)
MHHYSSYNNQSSPVGVIIFLLFVFGVSVFLAASTPISGVLIFLVDILGLGLIFGLSGVRVVNQYEKGIILTLGKYAGARGPGMTWIFVGFQQMIRVDLRIASADIPQQEVITKDNVTVGINAVVYYKVEDSAKAVLEIQNFVQAVTLYAQASLRDVIGGVELDTLLSERDKIADEIKKIVDVATDPWGIDVTSIKIQDIELPADMKRAMARQAEAERERRGVIIRADGEFSAAEKLKQAAELLGESPSAISLRTLQTIEKINPDPSKTVIFALPVEFFEGIKAVTEHYKGKK